MIGHDRCGLALTCRLQHRMAEEWRLRSSRLLPEGVPLGRSRNGAKQRRNHGPGESPVGGQGEMQLRARACPEREEADERAFVVEQTAAARPRIERRRRADDIAAIVTIEPFHDAVVNREIASTGKAGGDDAFPAAQRFRCADRSGRELQIGNADQAEVMRRAAGLDHSDPPLAFMRDFDGLCLARDVTSGRHQIVRDYYARAEALGTVRGDCAYLDEAVREVVCPQRPGRNARRRSDEAGQRNKALRKKLPVGHEDRDCRKCTTDFVASCWGRESFAKLLCDKGYSRCVARPCNVALGHREESSLHQNRARSLTAALLGRMHGVNANRATAARHPPLFDARPIIFGRRARCLR